MRASLSKSMTKVLRWADWWLSREADRESISPDLVSIELNRDFETATMNAEELVAIVQAWQAQLISRDSCGRVKFCRAAERMRKSSP